MKSYNRYYRVVKNDTCVTEQSANDFTRVCTKPYSIIWTNSHPVKVYHSLAKQAYSLYPLNPTYHDYVDKVMAMEKAKEGALKHISSLISEAELAISTLQKYRIDHYEDLNTNLIDSQIRKLERTMKNN